MWNTDLLTRRDPRADKMAPSRHDYTDENVKTMKSCEQNVRPVSICYVVCLLLNGWHYLGPKAEFKNP